MNTSNRLAAALKSLSLAASVALVALPVASHADADTAMDACVKAFVTANLPSEQPVKVRKIDTVDGPLNAHDRAYRITLKAVGSTSGKTLARGTCIVDRDGDIVALNGRPTTPKRRAPDAREILAQPPDRARRSPARSAAP